jgi:hypothetical protein
MAELDLMRIFETTQSVSIAFKKVNHYTNIEIVYHFKLSEVGGIYWVMRKGKCILKTESLEEAVNKFNSYKDI